MKENNNTRIATICFAAAGMIWLIERVLSMRKKSYFTIAELCKSTKADQLGIDNTPTPEAEYNLQQLIDNVLNPARTELGSPIYVKSGYRCPELNAAVDGEETSQHMDGEAADITAGNKTKNRKLFEILVAQNNYDQLIWEGNGIWIHVSYDGSRNRGQILAQNSSGGYTNIKNNWQTYIG